MICKYCGAELPENAVSCSACGKTLTEDERPEAMEADEALPVQDGEPVGAEGLTEAQPAGMDSEEAPTEEALEAEPLDGEPSGEEASETKPPVKRNKHRTIIGVLAALVAVLAIALVIVLVQQNGKSAAKDPQQTGDEASSGDTTSSKLQAVTSPAANAGKSGADVAGADGIVATYGDHKLTNQTFIYYYWDSFYSLYSNYGSYLSNYLDFSTPFDQQSSSDSETWHEYFVKMAVETWAQTMLLCDEAKAAGYELSEDDQADLDKSMKAVTTYADQYGYDSDEAYLESLFDPSSDKDSYYQYSYESMLATNYANSIYQKYYDQHYDPDAVIQYDVNVRHILIQPADKTSDASKAEAKAKAEELYAQWQKNPTEDAFSELAKANSSDTGSAENGGLYSDVYPGQMVDTFNDWCFDASRKAGDNGIVETSYGYHIMYFVGQSETVYSDPNADAAKEDYQAWLDDLTANMKYDADDTKVVFTAQPEK